MSPRRLTVLLLLAAAVGAVGLGIAGYATDALRRADLSTVDWRFHIRGTQEPPADVVLVAIDDASIGTVDQWPFRRGLHARVIDRLAAAGAKVIAYDVQFTEPSDDPRQDDRLIRAVRRAGNVVLATTEVDDRGRTRIFGGGDGLAFSRGIPSSAQVANDPGAIVRRTYLSDHGLDAFPVAAARAYRDGDLTLPERGDQWIDFPGPGGTIATIPFARVLAGTFDPAAVRGKIVVVGATSSSLQDLHTTSTTGLEKMSGPEIQADATQTVLDGFPLQPAPGWLDVALIVLLGAAAPLLATRLRLRWTLAITAVLAALAALGAQLAFDAGLIVSVSYAGVAAAIATITTIALVGMASAFERERVRELFGRFVPESVVGQVLSQTEGLRLGGTRMEATLMFSDLRGFTTFSEHREPDVVIDVLNRYLTEMSEAIINHGGTLVSYMGDGIMAVFGAPLAQDDHADRALASAREMLQRLERFNGQLEADGHGHGFKMGIGLNTGWVMSGNVGSQRRLEYTAIGDTTNTAARIESMTKGTPYQLFLADSTYERLSADTGDLVDVGALPVRGRDGAIRLWALRPGDPLAGPAPGLPDAAVPPAHAGGRR
jgi:adenylate cyclase